MQIKQPQQLIASPKSVSITVLDCNNFFSLDYEPSSFSEAHQFAKNQGVHSKSPHLERPCPALKNIYRINDMKPYRNGHNNSIANDEQWKNREGSALYVKSAQLQRKLLYTGKGGFHPYGRIRRVEQAIAQEKRNRVNNATNQSREKAGELCESSELIINKMSQRLSKIPKLNLGLSTHANSIIVAKHKWQANCQTQRISRGEQSDLLIKNMTINPETILQFGTICPQDQNYQNHEGHEGEDSIAKKNSKTINTFSQNYKNRKKLQQKATHRRSPIKQLAGSSNSPLRWDIKPEQLAYTMSLQDRSKHWSPYTGKLIDRARDPLLKSIEGNKIRYMHHEPKYFKGKLQEIHKI